MDPEDQDIKQALETLSMLESGVEIPMEEINAKEVAIMSMFKGRVKHHKEEIAKSNSGGYR